MNILHISKLNSRAAGVAVYNLHFSMIDKGYNSKILLENDSDFGMNDGVISYYKNYYWKFKIIKKKIYNNTIKRFKKDRINNKYNVHSLNELLSDIKTRKLLSKLNFEPDIIFVYFTHDFINTKILLDLSEYCDIPIYWYLMDMAPMTGGCHFAWDCEGYKNNCGNCPALFSSDPKDITFKNLQFKKNNLKNIDLSLIIGADWLIEKAKASSLFKDVPIKKIMLPVNESIYYPKDKLEARDQFGLPKNKKIFFFGAQSLRDPRKGIIKIIEALNLIKSNSYDFKFIDDLYFIYAGDYPEIVKENLQLENKYLGMLTNNESLASAYQASDFFICGSLQDTGPYMIIEAISCGIPVISFNMGLAYEFVKTGETGYKAQLGNVDDLANGIKYAANLTTEEYSKMSHNCLASSERYLRREKQVEEIIKLLNDIKK